MHSWFHFTAVKISNNEYVVYGLGWLLAFAKEEDEEFILGKVEAFEEDDAENNEDGPELVVDVSGFIQIFLRLE